MTDRPSVEVKICGIRDEVNLRAALEAGADYIGFIFVAGSPRYVSPENAAELLKSHARDIRPAGRKIVAVMADPSDQELADVLKLVGPDIIQLHGEETPERVRAIAGVYDIRLMKALPVATAEDVARAQDYVGYADMLLFDARVSDGPNGGTGQTFDWTLLQGERITLPWFLSGGLNARNVMDAVRITGAKRVDVSSGVESARGQKDPDLIRDFIRTVKPTGSEARHD